MKWNFEIGQHVQTENLDIMIIDRKRVKNRQYYKIKCNKCGFHSNMEYYKNEVLYTEYWIESCNLKRETTQCPCCGKCATSMVVLGINDIPTTDPWMVDYFQGGHDEAKMYAHSSRKRKIFKCPYCDDIKSKDIYIYQLYHDKKLSCHCNDGISMPNKIAYYFFRNMKNQISNYCREWNDVWCRQFYYDNYFEVNNNKYIVEMDGGWHYKDNNLSNTKVSQAQSIDEEKDKLAQNNNIIIIRIDCSEHNSDLILDRLINRMSTIINIKNVDKVNILSNSSSNLCKEICNYKQNNDSASLSDLSAYFMLHKDTIRKYLRIGNKCGWCKYETKYSLKNGRYNEAIKLKNENPEMTSKEIADKMNLSADTIQKYLKKGSENGLCVYDVEAEKKNVIKKLLLYNIKNTKKIKVITKQGIEVGVFQGAGEVVDYFKNVLHKIIDRTNIYAVCVGKRKTAYGHVFEYVVD